MIGVPAWASLQAEPEVRILLQEVYLGGDPRTQEQESGESEQGRKVNKGRGYSSCCHSRGSAAPPGPLSCVQMTSRVIHPKDGRLCYGTLTSVSLQVKAAFIPQNLLC